MNLVDDFLAYSLTVHKTYGEEASRYILECILQRKIRRLTVVPQKPWPGDTPEKHGIRLLELWFQVARHAKSLDEFTEKTAL